MVEILCNAKINLFLKVYGKRSDGFHDLISVMQSIDLADTLEIRQEPGKDFKITCSNPDVPLDENNSVRRAARLLSEECGVSLDGLRIDIKKDIPVMGGLAGGSADAAGTIAGLLKFREPDIPDKELLILAARIGSDVPFCLLGGTMLVGGRGERLEPLPTGLADLSPNTGAFVLAIPPMQISTREAYDLLDKTREKEANKWGSLSDEYDFVRDSWLNAISSGNFPVLFHNDFEDPIMGRFPELSAIRTHFRNTFGHAVMSGSGSCMFAYFPEMKIAHDVAEDYSPIAGEKIIVCLPVGRGVSIG